MIFSRIKALFSGRKSGGAALEGTVKQVFYKKGYGFIASPALEKQIFVHFTDARSRIKAGDKVRFRVEQTDKGPRAVDVEVIT